MDDIRDAGEFLENCCEIRLAKSDLGTFGLDNTHVLLEVRPRSDEYGIFYTAKGNQWDLWYRPDEAPGQGSGVAFAMGDPIRAACELLARKWRPDFDYDPEEDG